MKLFACCRCGNLLYFENVPCTRCGATLGFVPETTDPALREQMRGQMDEPYRTILWHFRHESGHYSWNRLVANGPWLNAFRTVFGDQTRDYAQALDHHYRNGPPGNWGEHFVNAYASSHHGALLARHSTAQERLHVN